MRLTLGASGGIGGGTIFGGCTGCDVGIVGVVGLLAGGGFGFGGAGGGRTSDCAGITGATVGMACGRVD